MGHKKVTALRWLMVSCPPYWVKDGGHFKKGLRSAKNKIHRIWSCYISIVVKFYADQDSYRKVASKMYMKRVTTHFT